MTFYEEINEEENIKEDSVNDEPSVEEEAVDEVPAEEEAKVEEEPLTLNIDYLSPEILDVREVSKDDLIEKSEEKFELKEDLVVNIKRNNIVKGNVVNVSERDVFIDIGFKTEGIVPLSEFKNPPMIGKELEVVVQKFEDT